MGFFGAADDADPERELTPDPAPAWRDAPPDNRRVRRDYEHGRSYAARCRRRGTSLPWHPRRWPAVRHFDCAPIHRLRRDRGAQSARWAAGVTVVTLAGCPGEQWTVTVSEAGIDPPDGAAYLRAIDPDRREDERRHHADDARAALRSRVLVCSQPAHAPDVHAPLSLLSRSTRDAGPPT